MIPVGIRTDHAKRNLRLAAYNARHRIGHAFAKLAKMRKKATREAIQKRNERREEHELGEDKALGPLLKGMVSRHEAHVRTRKEAQERFTREKEEARQTAHKAAIQKLEQEERTGSNKSC